MAIKGTARVIQNMSNRVRSIERRTVAGMWKAGLIVRQRSMQLTPVDTGNLKGSTFMHSATIKNMPVVKIGYTASYAMYVHEIPMKHKSPTQWKFLETALKEKRANVLAILHRSGRL